MLKQKNTTIPALATILAALILVLCFFMPYGVAKGDFKSECKENSNEELYEDFSMTAGDIVNVSEYEYLRIYIHENSLGDADAENTVRIVLLSIIAVTSLLVLVFALFKKGIGAIIMSILNLLAAFAFKFDLKDCGIVPSDSYSYGIAPFLSIILAIGIIVAAVWLKICIKKAKTETVTE